MLGLLFKGRAHLSVMRFYASLAERLVVIGHAVEEWGSHDNLDSRPAVASTNLT